MAEIKPRGADAAPPGYFSLWFSAIVPTNKLAHKRRLEEEDLPGLMETDKVAAVYSSFQSSYQATPLVGRALRPAVLRLAGVSAVLYGLYVGCIVGGPLILRRFLELIVEEQACDAHAGNDTLPTEYGLSCDERWFGYVLAAILLVTRIIGSFCLSHSEMLMTRAALRARSVLMTGLFRKCLRLSGVHESSTGQIQTLMAIDAEVVLMVAPVVNMLWSAPVQFVIYLVLLGLLIGKALGVGIAVMAFFLFVISPQVSKRLLKIRREQLKLTDQRVKVTNELVQGMRVVKLCGWEESMKSRLLAIRSKEMVKIRAGRFITALFSTLLATQLLFVAVGTFGSYVGFGGTLTGPSTMTALAYLTQLRFPLSFLPFIVIQTINLRISLTRVNRFLKNKEIGQKTQLPAPAPTAADEAADVLRKAASPESSPPDPKSPVSSPSPDPASPDPGPPKSPTASPSGSNAGSGEEAAVVIMVSACMRRDAKRRTGWSPSSSTPCSIWP